MLKEFFPGHSTKLSPDGISVSSGKDNDRWREVWKSGKMKRGEQNCATPLIYGDGNRDLNLCGEKFTGGLLLAPTEHFCPWYIPWANWRLTRNLQQWQWVETVVAWLH